MAVESFRRSVQTVLTALCGLFLVAAAITQKDYLAYTAVACGSYFALQAAYRSIRELSIDVNILMLLAAAGAVYLGSPLEAAGLLFLFSLSSTLEELAMAKTKSAIEGLIKLRPSEATLLTPDGDKRIPVEQVAFGDTVRVKAFEQIPVDGSLLTESASIDESSMTGESIPVSKKMGDHLMCGTQNLHEMMLMSVTAVAGETTLDRVVELVKDAQENKATGERISTWFGSRYTIFVLFAFAVSLTVRLALGNPFHSAMYEALVLFVALSPCAVVISIPATTLSALAWAARHGILVRGGAFIEALGRIDVIAMDKTGTLTKGKPELNEICVCEIPELVAVTAGEEHDACWKLGENMSSGAKRLLRCAAAAEQYSTHPIAAAIVAAARNQGLSIPEAIEQRDHAGMGVSAMIEGKEVRIGQRRFFENGADRLPDSFVSHVEAMQSNGMTVAVLSVDGELAAMGIRDEPRADAKEVVRRLRKLGIRRLVMLSGDTRQTVSAVGRLVGIEEAHGGLLPDQKTAFIEDLANKGHRVMMIGDGINDAPSLAAATVGVAMGSVGSDVALNAADVVLMKDNLTRIGDLFRLGRRAMSIINANLIFATGVIVTLSISTLFLKLPLWLAVVGHEGSTVLVLLNGLRLLRGPGQDAPITA